MIKSSPLILWSPFSSPHWSHEAHTSLQSWNPVPPLHWSHGSHFPHQLISWSPILLPIDVMDSTMQRGHRKITQLFVNSAGGAGWYVGIFIATAETACIGFWFYSAGLFGNRLWKWCTHIHVRRYIAGYKRSWGFNFQLGIRDSFFQFPASSSSSSWWSYPYPPACHASRDLPRTPDLSVLLYKPFSKIINQNYTTASMTDLHLRVRRKKRLFETDRRQSIYTTVKRYKLRDGITYDTSGNKLEL